MSPQDSTDNVGSKRFDIYSAMLAFALLGLILAVVLLSLEMGRYEWETAPRAQAPVVAPAEFAAHAHRA